MAENYRKREFIDLVAYHRNRDQYPEEKLRAYWGKQVAFSADGPRLVASGDDHEALFLRLHELGVDIEKVVFEFIDDPNVSYL